MLVSDARPKRGAFAGLGQYLWEGVVDTVTNQGNLGAPALDSGAMELVDASHVVSREVSNACLVAEASGTELGGPGGGLVGGVETMEGPGRSGTGKLAERLDVVLVRLHTEGRVQARLESLDNSDTGSREDGSQGVEVRALYSKDGSLVSVTGVWRCVKRPETGW